MFFLCLGGCKKLHSAPLSVLMYVNSKKMFPCHILWFINLVLQSISFVLLPRKSFSHQNFLHHRDLDGGLLDYRWKKFLHLFVLCFLWVISVIGKIKKSISDSNTMFFFFPSASSNLLFPALSLMAAGGNLFVITNMQVAYICSCSNEERCKRLLSVLINLLTIIWHPKHHAK